MLKWIVAALQLGDGWTGLSINFPSLMFVMISSYYHTQVAAVYGHFKSVIHIGIIKSPCWKGGGWVVYFFFLLGYVTIGSLQAM